LKPAASKLSTNACITSGRIMSAPLPAMRQRDRSKRSSARVCELIRREQMS